MINKRYTKMQYIYIYIYIYILIIYQNHLFVQCLQSCRYFFENGMKAQNEIPPSPI